MDSENSEVKNFGVHIASSNGEMIQKIYKAKFVFADEAYCSINVTAVSGCPDNLNERILHSTTPIRFKMEVKDDQGQDIITWSGVDVKGVEDKNVYTKGVHTIVRIYYFDVREALILNDGRQNASIIPTCSINLTEEEDINTNEHAVRITHEPTQAEST